MPEGAGGWGGGFPSARLTFAARAAHDGETSFPFRWSHRVD